LPFVASDLDEVTPLSQYLFLLSTVTFTQTTQKQPTNTKLETRNFNIGLLAHGRNKLLGVALGAAVLASLFSQSQKPISKQSTGKTEAIKKIAKNTDVLYKQLDQAARRISMAIQGSRDWTETTARSPRAIKTIKDLEAAIAMFTPTKQIIDYKISGYATGSRCWQCSPFQHPTSIQDLLAGRHPKGTRRKNSYWVRKFSKWCCKTMCWPSKHPASIRHSFRKIKEKPHHEHSHKNSDHIHVLEKHEQS
jgi:hypothetical protein